MGTARCAPVFPQQECASQCSMCSMDWGRDFLVHIPSHVSIAISSVFLVQCDEHGVSVSVLVMHLLCL